VRLRNSFVDANANLNSIYKFKSIEEKIALKSTSNFAFFLFCGYLLVFTFLIKIELAIYTILPTSFHVSRPAA
jgi:hypothetical protein